jgi:hypothetical protein
MLVGVTLMRIIHTKMFSQIKNLIFKTPSPPLVLSPQIDAYLVSQMIGAAIVSKQPFLASRVGFTEARCLSQPEAKTNPSEFIRHLIWRYSGVFPATAGQFLDFREKYISALEQVDLLGLIRNSAEKKLVDELASLPSTCDLGSLEPYLYPFPWSKFLAGKTVLVVHPFVKSIQSQYAIRKELFLNPDVLPEFQLIVIKAPQTLAGNTDGFASWTHALDSLTQRVCETEFDVAILGCGAYGMPLGAHIKKMGKTAIHLGGATQILFGISGKRWLERPSFRALMTMAWRPPLDSERPPNLDKVEEGCYW